MELVRLASEEVYSACGVSPSLLSGRNQANAREAYRQFVHGTVAPLGRLVAHELSVKLETEVSLQWEELRAADVASRARAFQSMVGAGMSLERAAALSGLMVPDAEV